MYIKGRLGNVFQSMNSPWHQFISQAFTTQTLDLNFKTTKKHPPSLNMDAIKNAAENKLNKDSQPGDGVERSADTAVDQRTNHPLVACQQPYRPHIAI